MSRTFKVRYNNWAVIKAEVPDNKLKRDSVDDDAIVRTAMGHAFLKQLNGNWTDGPDRVVKIDKASPGVWIGRRVHSDSGKKDEPFYVMEV